MTLEEEDATSFIDHAARDLYLKFQREISCNSIMKLRIRNLDDAFDSFGLFSLEVGHSSYSGIKDR